MVKLSWFLVPLFIAAAAAQNAAVKPANIPVPANEVRATTTAAAKPVVAPKAAAPKAAAVKPAKATRAAAAEVTAPTKSKKKIRLPHWVGPLVGKSITNACYRKSYITTNKQCATGYNADGAIACWAQCPIEYPVECGIECIQQNKDCTKAILSKVTSVVNVALTAATAGVFGEITKAAKGVQIGVRCTQQLYNTVVKITGVIDELEAGNAGASTKEKVTFAVMKSDAVVYDLPVAIATCIGIPVPPELGTAKLVIDVVKVFVDVVINKKLNKINILHLPTFLKTFKTEVPAVASNVTLTPADETKVQNLVKDGVNCGSQLYSVVNKIIAAVQGIKAKTPSSPVDIIKLSVLSSNLVLNELPSAASTCVDATTGFSKRDEILKSAHVIIEGVITASSDSSGKPLSRSDYAIIIAKMGLSAVSLIDPTGIAAMASQFIQPICGPTEYVGQIDSGPADTALGLKTVEKAFRGTTGTWTAKGDGKLSITFKSVDKHDVKINVMSGGKKVYSVPVEKGTTVAWSKPLSEFAGKTLYLDRWRAGFLGMPGTGGGSLLAWVPTDAATGSLTLQATINPTTFADHKLRRLNESASADTIDPVVRLTV